MLRTLPLNRGTLRRDTSREGHNGGSMRNSGLVLELVGQVVHPGSSFRHTASWQCLAKDGEAGKEEGKAKSGGGERKDYNAAENYIREKTASGGGICKSGEGGLGGGGGGSACSGNTALGGGGSTASTAFKQALRGKFGKKVKKEEARQGGGEAEGQGLGSSSTQALYGSGKQEAAAWQGGYDRILRRRIQGVEASSEARTDAAVIARSSAQADCGEGQEEARQGGEVRGRRRRVPDGGFQASSEAQAKEARNSGYEDRRRRGSEGAHPEGPSGRGDDGPLGPEHEGRSSAEAGPVAPRPWGPTALCAVQSI
jgi:hypothetical protein